MKRTVLAILSTSMLCFSSSTHMIMAKEDTERSKKGEIEPYRYAIVHCSKSYNSLKKTASNKSKFESGTGYYIDPKATITITHTKLVTLSNSMTVN